MQILDRIISYLFPDSCVGCKTQGSLLCGSCNQALTPALKPAEDWISSCYSFKDKRVSRLVWLLKYGNGKRVACIFAPAMAQAMSTIVKNHDTRKEPVVFLPVPISRERRRERGYNQAELLANAITRELSDSRITVETRLITRNQGLINQAKIRERGARQKNIANSFSVTPGIVPTSSVIVIIDDVTTTGATLSEMKATLMRAGFVHIYAQTAAH